MRRLLTLLLACLAGAFAQDTLRVASPNGQIEFRIFVSLPPEPGSLLRIGYQVDYRGKRLLDTSYLGIQVYTQDPILGENAGLIGSKKESSAHYNSLVAQYMQNGSLGRRIDVEARVFDDGVAFRYAVPRSTPLDELLIDDEATQFRFAGAPKPKPEAALALPALFEQAAAWVSIGEAPVKDYGRMSLAVLDDRTLVSHLAARKTDPRLAYEGAPPMKAPWRVLAIGPSADSVRVADLISRLTD